MRRGFFVLLLGFLAPLTVPNAHYAYTIHDGVGVLAGATGAGDVVADNGVDRWHGTLTLLPAPASPQASASSAASPAPKASARSERPG